jgi:hypothetical protein
MMFVPHGKHTYGPPWPDTRIFTIFYVFYEQRLWTKRVIEGDVIEWVKNVSRIWLEAPYMNSKLPVLLWHSKAGAFGKSSKGNVCALLHEMLAVCSVQRAPVQQTRGSAVAECSLQELRYTEDMMKAAHWEFPPVNRTCPKNWPGHLGRTED